MTKAAIDALTREIAHVSELNGSLGPDEWTAASACDGWRVQDVIQHMASVFQQIAEPSSIDVGESGHAEEAAEVPVQARREWTSEEVVAAYAEWSEKGLAALAGLQEPPMADTVVPLSDLGSHPLHLLANAIVFDHYCHLRHDIGATVDRAAALPRDEEALAATLDWMLAGLPQMCSEALAIAPAQPVNLVFVGPAAGRYGLAPSGDIWSVTEGVDDAAPTVSTTVHDFVSWGTKRSDWRDLVTGDTTHPDAAAVLDAINVI
jgi:uncharacterized protein (TIGR03083 family)